MAGGQGIATPEATFDADRRGMPTENIAALKAFLAERRAGTPPQAAGENAAEITNRHMQEARRLRDLVINLDQNKNFNFQYWLYGFKRWQGGDPAPLTLENALLGYLSYMAPEGAVSSSIDMFNGIVTSCRGVFGGWLEQPKGGSALPGTYAAVGMLAAQLSTVHREGSKAVKKALRMTGAEVHRLTGPKETVRGMIIQDPKHELFSLDDCALECLFLINTEHKQEAAHLYEKVKRDMPKGAHGLYELRNNLGAERGSEEDTLGNAIMAVVAWYCGDQKESNRILHTLERVVPRDKSGGYARSTSELAGEDALALPNLGMGILHAEYAKFKIPEGAQ